MSLMAKEAYERLNSAMGYLRESMAYVPHRFGTIRKRHDELARDMATVATTLSQYHFMFDGEPSRAKKQFQELKKEQRARLKVKSTW